MTGGTGVIGRSAVRALVDAGHRVEVTSRSARENAVIGALGARTVAASVFDADALVGAFEGADAVISLVASTPIGYAGLRSRAWRRHDNELNRGVANTVEAARRAGVRRVVQESSSSVYADAGNDWITEEHPLDITPVTEPLAVAEALVLGLRCGSRTGVVLRFGRIVGDEPNTRLWLRAAEHNRPFGLGRPDGWAHLIHTDDLGSAVLAALHVGSGIYNVGAHPIRCDAVIQGYADGAHVASGSFLGPVQRRVAGPRLEPLDRSLRVSSDHFAAQSGWSPTRPEFGADWFDVVGARHRELSHVGRW